MNEVLRSSSCIQSQWWAACGEHVFPQRHNWLATTSNGEYGEVNHSCLLTWRNTKHIWEQFLVLKEVSSQVSCLFLAFSHKYSEFSSRESIAGPSSTWYWSLHSFYPLFCYVHWAKMEKLWSTCIQWGWAPHSQLTSALCPVVIFCDGLHFLEREALIRSGLICGYKEKIWNIVRNYAGLAKWRL